ncbi:MAG: integrase/recombinase XerD [Marivirga sp.]|jgi:integrase/recombinase XerD
MSIQKNQILSTLLFVKKHIVKEGTAPIYLRITTANSRIESSLGRKIDLKSWSKKKQRAVGQTTEIKQLNRFLDHLINKTNEIFQLYLINNEYLSAEVIKNKLFNLEEENTITLLSAAQYHYDNNQQTFAEGTLKHYKVTERYFVRFLKAKKKLKDIPLERVDLKIHT